ncbi:MAG TPA: SpoIIE family protein phosphatase [Blastocatellia bacterium]|jgi:FixJ family two-component response regulator|nr:SpoIIE family protein phosphatase [Blastocatellia bacterium]
MNIGIMKTLDSSPPRTLIADDQPDILEALRLLLKGEGFHTEVVTSPAEVIEALKQQDYDILLMDLNYARDTTSGQEGLDLLAHVQALDSTLPIVVMTAWGSIELTVEAMRRGVRDFVLKPWENARLLNILRTQIENGHVLRKKERLKAERKILSSSIFEADDLKAMLQLVAGHIEQALESRGVAIFTRGLREHSFAVTVRSGALDDGLGELKFEPDADFLRALNAPLEGDHTYLPEGAAREAAEADDTLIVPIKVKGELIGFICVGGRPSGEPFDADDMNFLDRIVDQVGIGINNLLARGQQHELEEARDIQRGLLPKVIPQIQGYEISGAWRPAHIVSGDYFDVLKFDEDRAALCIADVSGKGMPAALLMSNVQAAVKAFASATAAPAEVCEKVNRVVCSNTAEDKFITFFYCLLDATTGTLTYANAGHNAPILIRRDGASLQLERGGTVLGPFPEWEFDQGETMLHPGDRVLLFTDGITEVRNTDGEEFGEERLNSLLVSNRELGAAELQKAVMSTVANFSGGDFQDDATLMVLSVN